jgi:hypothetical protein
MFDIRRALRRIDAQRIAGRKARHAIRFPVG